MNSLMFSRISPLAGWVTACGLAVGLMNSALVPAADEPESTSAHRIVGKAPADRTGRARVGKASFYAGQFVGRKMADGTRMDPHADNAASRTLPLGTTARVTNLQTGRSAVVTIRDRGPYVDGRIIDLTPATAHKIGLEWTQGVTRVVVAPIAVPLPDGELKLGAGFGQLASNEGPW
jgi:rare lipoprotein A